MRIRARVVIEALLVADPGCWASQTWTSPDTIGFIMISRHWRGLAKPPHADAYVQHLRSETLPELSKIPGFINASILRRNVQQGAEFLVVTTWESTGAIEQFAGRDSELAVVPEKVQEMMIEYDRRARHYEVLV